MVIESQIKTLKNEIDGLLIDKGRVTDHLLDLRIDAAAREDIVEQIDSILRDVPGSTVVEGSWWSEHLDGLLEVVERVPAG